MNQRFDRRDFLKSAAAGAGALAVVRSGEATAAPPAVPAIQEDVSGKVTMLTWAGPPIIDIRQQVMEPLKQRYPGIEFELVSVPGGGYTGPYGEKLRTMIAGGIPPDLFIIPDTALPFYLVNDLALDLSPFVERDTYDLSAFPTAVIDSYRYKGGLYGLPDNISSIGFFANTTLFEEAGIEPPPTDPRAEGWDFAAYRSVAEEITRRDGDKTTVFGATASTDLNSLMAWVWSNGGDLLTPDRTALALDEPAALEAIQFQADLIHEYKVAPSAQNLADISENDLFKTGRVATVNGCVCSIASFREIDAFSWDAFARPAGNAGRVDYLYAFPWLISSSTKAPDAAWAVLTFFQDEAMPEIVKAGALQGTKLTHQEIFLRPDQPPEHGDVFIHAVEETGRVLPKVTNYSELEAAIRNELDRLWSGEERDAAKVIADLKRKADPLVLAGRFED